MTRVVALFRDPTRTFLLLAIVVGGYLVFVVPYFGGIDEPAHFSRSYQISTGQFVPEKIGNSEFSGACLPNDVAPRDARLPDRVLQAPDRAVPERTDSPGRRRGTQPKQPKCPSKDETFVTFSTFGSPVPYLPQAAAIFVDARARSRRGRDADRRPHRRCSRCTWRSSRSRSAARRGRRWALCAVALIPVAVFQSASSLSPDAFTNAVALLVVSSALRALDPPRQRDRPNARHRSRAAERAARDVQARVRGGRGLLPAAAARAAGATGEALGPRTGRRGRRGRDVRLERDRRRSLAHGRHVLRHPARSAGAQARAASPRRGTSRPTRCAPSPTRSGTG